MRCSLLGCNLVYKSKEGGETHILYKESVPVLEKKLAAGAPKPQNVNIKWTNKTMGKKHIPNQTSDNGQMDRQHNGKETISQTRPQRESSSCGTVWQNTLRTQQENHKFRAGLRYTDVLG